MSGKKFQEPEALTGVADFHHLFGMPILDQPEIPSEKRCELRVSLLQEELDELKEAIEDKDIVGIADALADLQYVLSGAVLEFGLGDKFKALFDEVQRSNMSKACSTNEEALATQKYYKDNRDTESEVRPSDGKLLVFRKGDGKVLKSVNYSPADLRSIVEDKVNEAFNID